MNFFNDENDDIVEKQNCSECLDEIKLEDSVELNCGHEFCCDCIGECLMLQKERCERTQCPVCQSNIDDNEYRYVQSVIDDSINREMKRLRKSNAKKRIWFDKHI